MPTSSKFQSHFFYAMLIIASVIMLFIFLPYLSALFLAGVLSIIFFPVYGRVLKIFFGKSNLAALFTVLLILVVILAPVGGIGFLVFQETHSAYSYFTTPEGSDRLAGDTQIFLDKFLP